MNSGRRISTGARPSFTLIELPVVIAILAAMLPPTLGRAKTKLLQAKCLSNQKQIGAVFAMYTGDFKESYPSHPDGASVGGKDSWPVRLFPGNQ